MSATATATRTCGYCYGDLSHKKANARYCNNYCRWLAWKVKEAQPSPAPAEEAIDLSHALAAQTCHCEGERIPQPPDYPNESWSCFKCGSPCPAPLELAA